MNDPLFTAGKCANCDSPDITGRRLFCSQICRQTARLVRYVRACHRDGRYLHPDVQEAIRMKVAHVLAGGYPADERRVPENVRAEVFQRAHGHCERCGRDLDFDRSSGDHDAVATLQHLRGNSNDHANLKAWCMRCNFDDAKSRFVPVQEGSNEELALAQLRRRFFSPSPVRLCDDDMYWSRIWRSLLWGTSEKVDIEDIYGYDDDDPLSDEDLLGFLGWTDQGTPIQEF